uniref:C-type lectin domain-containing protein n=1 Tax=Kryptolebias marmoratus TaxID=37003 RepID=A0A3Q3B0X3_KRYMA
FLHPGEKLIRVVAVSFGLLCVLQAAANITLRLYFQQGWVYLHPSFYYISTTEKSWQASRDDCLQRDDLTRQFQRLTWIGLRNETITRQWTWVDGTPLTKRLFSLFWHLKANCWNDRLCSAENFWICEKNVTQKIK